MGCSICLYRDWCSKLPQTMSCKEVFAYADSVETDKDRERWFDSLGRKNAERKTF